ncbi:hypothetical protein [Olleya sp. 1-3]|uniref:hypothetical protein n=1 Tax=Olleya sp. 1-3 TaxID=2058323 RepID=UPI000C322256|nr:hypothetical protein [Olleya sp. 1-3]PKG51139.1 hypothetical protein CXF54_09520 [Olleya sp. 1-3]
MKKLLFTLLLSVATITSAMAQEWLTSLTLAKKLALSKNKMLLVIWEDSANYSYPIILEDTDGTKVVTELFESDAVKTLVWKYFVPVIINESMYQQLFDKIDGKRNMSYINRFNDDNVKVMDPNGNILDLRTADEFMTQDLTAIIKKYALDTSFLEAELNSYFENKNYATTFRLANKYLDFAIYAEDFVKEEIIMLSGIYMLEAENLLQNSDYATKEALLQKHELLKIKEALILGKDNKARRMLKKYTKEDIDKINVALFAFLNYATYRSLDNIEEALPWKAQVLQSDLNKVKFIVNK